MHKAICVLQCATVYVLLCLQVDVRLVVRVGERRAEAGRRLRHLLALLHPARLLLRAAAADRHAAVVRRRAAAAHRRQQGQRQGQLLLVLRMCIK